MKAFVFRFARIIQSILVIAASSSIQGDLRLTGGHTLAQGNVEIYHSGEWRAICNEGWDFSDARVVCKQLGYPDAVTNASFYGPTNRTVWIGDVDCDGTESSLLNCSYKGWGVNCSQGRSAAVSCDTQFLRLRGGSNSFEGRIEFFHEGEWGTLCDDWWDINDATVLCHQLGYSGAVYARGNAYFGEGSGPIWLGNVQCDGTETEIEQCAFTKWESKFCDHSEDAGLTCCK
jgi:hypothetical protein